MIMTRNIRTCLIILLGLVCHPLTQAGSYDFYQVVSAADYAPTNTTNDTLFFRILGADSVSLTGVSRKNGWGVLGVADSVYIPATATDSGSATSYRVVAIGDSACCKAGFSNVSLPASLRTIGAFAFTETPLDSVFIPDQVTIIGRYAFCKCTPLCKVRFSNNLTRISAAAFEDCINLREIDLPASLTVIWEEAFARTGLTSLTLPTTVAPLRIYERAFMSCNALAAVNFGGNISHVASMAFQLCYMLTSVTIPAGVQHIGCRAFSGCSKLTTIHVDVNHPTYSSLDGVLCNKAQTKIITFPYGRSGEYAVPQNIRTIGDSAFMACTKLTSIRFPNTLDSIGCVAFRACTGLTSVTLPDSLKMVYHYTFYGCNQLKSVHLANIRSVHQQAFYQCPLTSLYLPETLTRISQQSFLCDNLSAVYCAALTPPVLSNTNAFYFSTSKTQVDTLYVPWRSLDTYRASAEWTAKFKHIEGYTFNVSEVEDITTSSATIKWEPDTLVSRYAINLYRDSIHIAEFVIDNQGALIDSTHFAAPVRPAKKDTTTSTDEFFVLTVGDLAAGSAYQYTIDGYAESGDKVYHVAGAFVTVQEDVPGAINYFEPATDTCRQNAPRKRMYNGEVYIIDGNRIYSIRGVPIPRPTNK